MKSRSKEVTPEDLGALPGVEIATEVIIVEVVPADAEVDARVVSLWGKFLRWLKGLWASEHDVDVKNLVGGLGVDRRAHTHVAVVRDTHVEAEIVKGLNATRKMEVVIDPELALAQAEAELKREQVKSEKTRRQIFVLRELAALGIDASPVFDEDGELRTIFMTGTKCPGESGPSR